MQQEAGDIGTIMMESCIISLIPRPAAVTPAIKWGGDGLSFKDKETGWVGSSKDQGTGWGLGTVSITSQTVNLAMKAGTSQKSVFQQVNPVMSYKTLFPSWESNKLVRITYNLSSSDTSACPQIRMVVLPYTTNFSRIGNTLWGEALDPSVWRTWYSGTLGLGLAGAPKTTGSVIETYIYTMNAPTDPAETSMLTPLLDIDQNKDTDFPVNGWQKPNATVTISGCSMEVLSTN